MSARSQMMLFGMGLAPASVTFTDESNDTTDTATYSFASQAIGTASADRRVIVGIYGAGANTAAVTAVTVGGISATAVVAAQSTTGQTELWIAAVPTGTTATIDITFAASKARCGIVVWAATSLNSSTATATQSDTTFSTNTLDVSINIQAGGIAVGMAGMNSATAGVTWAGITEVADSTVESVPYSGASDNFATAQSGLTVSATFGTAGSNPGLVVAAFR